MTALDRLKVRIPGASDGSKDALLSAYLEDALEYILSTTGRTELPGRVEPTQVQLATILYNRQGIEGEQAHTTGGVSRTLFSEEDLPASLRRVLQFWRVAKVTQRMKQGEGPYETTGEG